MSFHKPADDLPASPGTLLFFAGSQIERGGLGEFFLEEQRIGLVFRPRLGRAPTRESFELDRFVRAGGSAEQQLIAREVDDLALTLHRRQTGFRVLHDDDVGGEEMNRLGRE